MKNLYLSLFLLSYFQIAYSQTNRPEIDRQIEELMRARNEMLKSLMDDSNFDNFDSHFQDMVKRFQQGSFQGFPDTEMGDVVGEYDWRESDTERTLMLKVKQIKDKPLDIKIEKGQIILKGDVESVSENKKQNQKKISKVHFERTFSIPNDVDQTNPQFENKEGELLIKFKKLKPSKSVKDNKKSLPKDSREPLDKTKEDTII